MIEQLATPITLRDHVRGRDGALITLVEYGDFACPFCAAAYPVLRRLLLRYAGALRLVFRHNPRGELHEGAHLAALAAEAAGFQGQFWPMHDLLFQQQSRISESAMVSYALLLGLDVALFQADMHSRAVAARVKEDEVGGLRSGVVGTPTFFVNGLHFHDKPDFDGLTHAIEAQMPSTSRAETSTTSLRT